jgi:hypothetical protein
MVTEHVRKGHYTVHPITRANQALHRSHHRHRDHSSCCCDTPGAATAAAMALHTATAMSCYQLLLAARPLVTDTAHALLSLVIL